MKLGELQDIIDLSITQKQRSQMVSGNIRDKEVLITVANGSTINTRPSVKIKSAEFGFDWESHQFRIEPEQNLFVINTYKRYLLFAYQEFYSKGGMHDCLLKTNDYQKLNEEAIDYAAMNDYDHIQYYDCQTGDIFVWDYERREWKDNDE